jgi:hypothetical protein
MNYRDSVDQPIAPGDWVVYAKSGYARIAKILDIKLGQGKYQTAQGVVSDWEITLMTCSGKKAISRDYKVFAGRSAWSLIRIDRPPATQENVIETRIARM